MAAIPPGTDSRRASKLREALEKSAPMLAPDWAGLAHEGDFGRALLQIAARLAEHSTQRLDRTALRDKLAFLDALDVATPGPRSAIAPIVFTLAEKRDTPVFAPARVQISADRDGGEIVFETREAIDLTPARLSELIAADPAADWIESAPAFVTDGLDKLAPATRYALLSAVETGSRILQLVQAVGLQPDDLLRLAGNVYRVEKVDGAIVTLRDKLTSGAPAEATIEKLIALEAFALRNLQDHAVFVGHKELLKLDGPAEITLVFDPTTLPARLAALDLEYSMWGKAALDGEEVLDWHPLEFAGADGNGLRLAKTWEGSVEELELPAGGSRWVRVRLKSPIAGACGPPTDTVSVRLKVRSIETEASDSPTVTAAFYNGQPLPTSSPFFPFGPEPQRFDIFAFTAPEALSKKGATVTLTITLDDASLEAMAYDPKKPDHVYAVSANGRLQSIRFAGDDNDKRGDWRQLGLPPPAAGTAGEPSARLDGTAQLHVLHVDGNNDLVFAQGEDKAIHFARVETTATGWKVAEWQRLAPQAGRPVIAFCAIRGGIQAPRAPATLGRVVAADADGFHSLEITAAGSLSATWKPLASNLAPSEPAAIAVAGVEGARLIIALIYPGGEIHRGDVDLAANNIGWAAFSAKTKIDLEIPPLAFLDDDEMVAIAGGRAEGEQNGENPTHLIAVGQDGASKLPKQDLTELGDVRSIALLPDADGDAPFILAAGTGGILVWRGEQSDIVDLPGGANPKRLETLALPPDAAPKVLLDAGGELVLEGLISPGDRIVELTLRDCVRRDPSSAKPSHVLIDNQREKQALNGAWLADDGKLVHLAPENGATSYALIEKLSGTVQGTRVSDRVLAVAAGALTDGDYLEIGQKMYKAVLNTAGDEATLDADLPAGGTFACALFRPTTSAAKFLKKDRMRFAKPDGTSPTDAVQLSFSGKMRPKSQEAENADGPWLLLAKAWTTLPTSDRARAALLGELGLQFGSSQIRLPREADNPELSWEYFDGDGWRRLDKGSFTDATRNFAATGQIVFTVPDDLGPTEIAGKEDYWIRARLIGGDYGRASYVVKNEPETGNPKTTSITIDRSRLNPPEIISIDAAYQLDDDVAPDCVVADNNRASINQTEAALAQGAVFNLFEGVAQHVDDADGGSRALYLGFGRSPAIAALNLYADAVDRDAPPGELIAEALTRDGWRRLAAADDTKALTRPGLLRLFLSPAPEQLPLFGRDGWWLRLRPKQVAARWAPVLRGLFVNAVLAEHAKSVRQEILGSSLGEPDQRYTLAQTPVLPATLELRVREALGEEEAAAIVKRWGRGAIYSGDPDLPGDWVEWRQVPTFVDQAGDARVYRVDPASGEIRFGDGRCGKIPPPGADSIRAFSYQQGGGSDGNVPARAIANLSSAIESVELALNPVDAAGGADPPSATRLAETGPALLRHGGRALAPADIESIATGSAPDVVRARCLAREGCGIELAVAIRERNVRCPVPSRARREGIARNILDAGWGALPPDSVIVHPPRYVPVVVDATVLAKSADAVADVDRDIRQTLLHFLHPIEGGPDDLGWRFGRRPWPSDLEGAVANVAGLDRVIEMKVEAKAARGNLDTMPPDGLICLETADLTLVVMPPGDGR